MATTSELRLSIVLGSEPIAGDLALPDGHTLHFEGYMQLVGILEGVRRSARAEEDGDEVMKA